MRLTASYLDDEATELENYQMEYGLSNKEVEDEDGVEEEDRDEEEDGDEEEEEVEARNVATQPKNKFKAKK